MDRNGILSQIRKEIQQFENFALPASRTLLAVS